MACGHIVVQSKIKAGKHIRQHLHPGEVYQSYTDDIKERGWQVTLVNFSNDVGIPECLITDGVTDEFTGKHTEFIVDDDIYRDGNGNLLNIKTCRSKWASPTDVNKWNKQVNADMVKIKDNCDRSGKHGFSLKGVFDVNDEHYQDFVQNFAQGQKAICYLGALAMYCGTEKETCGKPMQSPPLMMQVTQSDAEVGDEMFSAAAHKKARTSTPQVTAPPVAT